MSKFWNRRVMMLLLVFGVAVELAGTDRLIFVQSIFRHGVRYPANKEEADLIGETTDVDKVGQLTSEGKYMIYLLGKIFYERYWMRLFGGTQYENKYDLSQINIRSTSYDRTIQSAYSFMVGLLEKLPSPTFTRSRDMLYLPAFANAESYEQRDQASVSKIYGSLQNVQSIAVQVEKGESYVKPSNLAYEYLANPYDEGDFLNKFMKDNCPNQKKWEVESENSEIGLWIRNYPIFHEMIRKFEELAGREINYTQAFRSADGFVCLEAMNLPYNQMFNDPEMARAARYFAWINIILSKAYDKTHLKAGSTILLQKTLGNIKAAIENKGPKMVIYSAHDTTIIVLAGVLKMMTLECVLDNFVNRTDNSDTCCSKPQFGSSFNLELWQSGDKSYRIKFLYNGEYRKIIPVCGGKEYCQLGQFTEWVESVTDEDPNTLCGISPLQLPLNTPKNQAKPNEDHQKRQHLSLRTHLSHHHLSKDT